MSECNHEFTRVDMRGNWLCAKYGIAEIVHLRARAETAENELVELKAENERLKAELEKNIKLADLCWPVVEAVINSRPHAEPLDSLAKKAFFNDI